MSIRTLVTTGPIVPVSLLPGAGPFRSWSLPTSGRFVAMVVPRQHGRYDNGFDGNGSNGCGVPSASGEGNGNGSDGNGCNGNGYWSRETPATKRPLRNARR